MDIGRIQTVVISHFKKLGEKFFAIDSNKTTLANALKIIKKLFWVIAYLAGFVISVMTCVYIYVQFENYPVSLSVYNVRNDTIILPDITICLPNFHAEQVGNFWMMQHDYTNASCMGNDCDAFGEALSYELQWNYTYLWYEIKETEWSFPMLYFTQRYLGMVL